MRVASLFVIAALPAFSLSQSIDSLAADLPICALGPFTIAAGQSQCSTDAKCLCSDKTFISSVTKKVEDACSKEEVDTMVKVATEACKSANVTVDIPLGAKDNSTADGESWGERSSTVNFAMMVGVLGLAAQAVL